MRTFIEEWQSRSLLEMLADYIRSLGSRPCDRDPWPEDIDRQIRGPEALPVCHRCFLPLDEPVWFCPDCGTSVGPYNNWIPNLALFTVGEVLRSGFSPSAKFTKLTVPGYVVTAFCAGSYIAPLQFFIAPFYCIRLLIRLCQEGEGEVPNGDEET